MICKICDKDMTNMNIRGKVQHIRNAHDLDYLEYNVKYEDFKIPKCKICVEKDAKRIKGIDFRETCGSKECISKACSNNHSEEMKKTFI